ncbi:MAG: hypothetical protein D6718_04930 [Acidobacteria bacterium]|nr:MAG: hypothetical protein D6718_04930 [Acidobacteriota bacterium]
MRTRAAALFIAGCALMATAGSAERAADRRERLDREIARLEAERERLAEQEKGVLARIDRLSAEARLLDARLERLDLERRRLMEERADLGQRREAEERALAESRARLRAAVRVLQRIGPLGRLRPLLDAPDAGALAASLRAVHRLTTFRKQRAEEIEAALSAIAAATRGIEERSRRLEQLEREAAEQRASLERAIRKRRELLSALERDRKVREEAIAELARAREELRRRIAEGGSGPPIELDVRKFRGLLPMPVDGQVVRGFGERSGGAAAALPHPGWDIEAPFGAEVRVPFDGRVVWTGWLRGYGLVVVVDHGHGVHTVAAHLSAVLADAGENVESGQVVGLVGDTGSLRGPHLYFEIREGDRAVDPALWIDRKRRPAAGLPVRR